MAIYKTLKAATTEELDILVNSYLKRHWQISGGAYAAISTAFSIGVNKDISTVAQLVLADNAYSVIYCQPVICPKGEL